MKNCQRLLHDIKQLTNALKMLEYFENKRFVIQTEKGLKSVKAA